MDVMTSIEGSISPNRGGSTTKNPRFTQDDHPIWHLMKAQLLATHIALGLLMYLYTYVWKTKYIIQER